MTVNVMSQTVLLSSGRPNGIFIPMLIFRKQQLKHFQDAFTLMMLLRRGAAFTDSWRKVSVSWPAAGRMTPLRRPRDALGGM